ncbi:hypothetical protein [Dyadobacter sp. Leaf189]|uniref:hypothetical protein n=1 Tax=Dyadobacter sp. Leaf189 TaxID=1736295 RepID=UPI0006F3F568|nr:hypothetical protein [Dyadobacter sp. Leaf189]KQS30759.1 hypothetical protein ASG33_10265 [Dyadobacter sp. Leaf189]
MKAKEKSASGRASRSNPYLTKRLLISRAQSAGRAAAKEAMQIMGYVVTVTDGWVVKRFADGSVEKIKELKG